MKPRPKRVVLQVLSLLRGRPAPVRFLVATTSLFGIDANATRVAITRLLAAGLIERDERGAYRTGAAAVPVVEKLSAWRSIEEHSRTWDGSWLGTTPDVGTGDKDARALSARAVGFAGLREFTPGLWIRPGNFAGGLGAMREALRSFGLNRDCPVFSLRDLDAPSEARALSLWDREDLPAAYRALTAELRRSAESLASMPARQAMAESFLLGGKAIRSLVLDPMLPDAIVPTAARDELLATTIAYDGLGRRCWAPFLESHGIDIGDSAVGAQPWRDASRDFGYEEQAAQAGGTP